MRSHAYKKSNPVSAVSNATENCRSTGNFSALNYLALDRNELSRTVPSALVNLQCLEHLDLDINRLDTNKPTSCLFDKAEIGLYFWTLRGW